MKKLNHIKQAPFCRYCGRQMVLDSHFKLFDQKTGKEIKNSSYTCRVNLLNPYGTHDWFVPAIRVKR